MTKIGIVLLHYIDKKLTGQCLVSVKKLKKKDFELEVVIVNNNPQEDLTDLKKKFQDFLFLEAEKNLGFTGGNNLGIKKALGDGANFVFLVNNDALLDKDLLVQLFKLASLDNQIGILGPKIYFAPGYEFHKERYKPTERGKVIWYAGGKIDWENVLSSHQGVDEVDKGQYDKQAETDFVSGCAMLVRKEVFEKVGLLDERYFLYLEDLEFCQRAKRAGFKIVYAPKTKLWHLNAASSEVGGSLHDYYSTRNRMLFGMKYASWRTKLALFRESLRLLFTGRQWQRIGIRDFYLGKFGKGSYEKN